MATTTQGLRRLGEVDVTALVAALDRVPEERWWADARRQARWPDEHGATQSLLVEYRLAGPPAVDDGLRALVDPVLRDVGALVAAHAGGARAVAANVLVTRLPAGCEIPRHTDGGVVLRALRRIHVPLKVNAGCTFTAGGVEHHPAVGTAYELANHEVHAAANRGATPRLHLISDWLVDGDGVRTR
jgi:hypothetical protein